MSKKKFNSLKEYIEHLIYKKDILNMKNIMIFLVIIGVISVLSLQISKSIKTDFDWFEGDTITKERMIESLVSAGYSEHEINAMNDDELNRLFNEILISNNGQQAGNSKYKEFPEQDASILKQDYYLKASDGDFDYIISDFEDKKLKYLFSTTYNKELITIYNDAYYLKTITNDTTDKFKIKEILSSIRDPQMLLYGALLTEESYRRDILVDKFSLSPVLVNKHIVVSSKFSTSMYGVNSLEPHRKDAKFTEMAQYLNDGNYIFYKFDITIDNNPLSAYIYKDMNSFDLSLYGLYSNEAEHPYRTVYDFIQIDSYVSNIQTLPKHGSRPIPKESS